MSVLPIVKYPSEILEVECEKVTVFDRKLSKLIKDMYDTMLDADGVGLAAPQVGIAKQIAIVDIGDESGLIELINPVILEQRGEQIGPEGCLSFPDLFGEVTRFDYIKVRAQNRRGKTYIYEANDFLARAIQHEIDHLHGILFTTKVNRFYEEGEIEG
ncbi:peptide deformylase [Bacillus sinesaloumensis]|uniref:peptide deformylase n=1 Tax=Litchfieldia sinesaloumensis TaxID=1926280 RepID=UPI0009888625|nr:peptide deformylase [Bacillus sinesaloumensis]